MNVNAESEFSESYKDDKDFSMRHCEMTIGLWHDGWPEKKWNQNFQD